MPTLALLPPLVGAILFVAVTSALAVRRGRGRRTVIWAGGAVLVGGLVAAIMSVSGIASVDRAVSIGTYVMLGAIFVALLRGAVPGPAVLAGLVVAGIGWTGARLADMPDDLGRLPDMPFAALDGPPQVLGAGTDTPLVVNLWATWCGPCRREMPMLLTAASEASNVDFAFVNQGEPAIRIHSFLATMALDGADIYLDPDSVLMRKFGVLGLPATYFFDPDGALQHVHIGEITASELADAMSALTGPDAATD